MDALLELDSFNGTCEALSIIYGSQEADMETFKSFVYEGYLLESGASADIVMEGALDIFKSIANGIKNFIEKVKAFFKKILLYITSATEDLDKLAKEVKPIVKDMDDIDFTIDGYHFTVIDKSGPNMTEFQRIVSEYNTDMDDISKLKEGEIKNKVTEWMSDKNLDKLRGIVLGTGDSIPEDEYLDTIREYYRNGESDTDSIKVDKTMVNSIMDHAKKLEDVKKSSIKDRDTLITLLSKTQAFFERTLPTMYKGNNLQVNVSKVDTTNNKFSKTDNYVNAGDATIKLVSTYATLKSRQVNKIASMINLVACERVNALRDQIKQERTILRKCLFSEKKSDSTVDESVQVFPNTGYNGRDFVTYTMESDILHHHYYDQVAQMVLLNEASFLINSVNSGEVQYMMEADEPSKLNQVKQVIGDIIESVVAAFRKKAIGDTNKYKAWIAEVKDGLADKAKNKKEFKMANFANADYTTMANSIVSAIRKAYSNKDYDNYDYAKGVITGFDSLEKMTADDSRTLMLNYFRTGKADEKLDVATISGSELANRVTEMVKYVEQYGTSVTKPAENISSTFKSQTEAFKVTESAVTGSTYLDLLGCPICESEVALCTDYNSMFSPVTESIGRTIITEAGDAVKIGRGNDGVKDANASIGDQSKATGAEGEKEAKDINSATQATSVDKTEAEGGETKTNNAAVTYKKNTDRFFKNCITLYIKAREEQFLAYINAIAEIDGARPQFDKNGRYIPKAKKAEDDKAAVNAESK